MKTETIRFVFYADFPNKVRRYIKKDGTSTQLMVDAFKFNYFQDGLDLIKRLSPRQVGYQPEFGYVKIVETLEYKKVIL